MTVKANSAKKNAVSICGRHVETALRCCIGTADDNRMNGAEQADGKECDRCADAADERIDGAKAGALFRIVNALTQHEVGDIDQFGDRGCGETRIPRPPGVPGRTRPDRTKHNRDQEEDQADFNRRDLKAIPLQILV